MKDINATVVVNLKPAKEEIFQNLQKDARWGIKKAIKEGLAVEEAKDEKSWNDFYEVYKKELAGKRVKIETFEHIKEHGSVFFICKKQGKIIAGATIALNEGLDGIPKLSRNASLPEYLNLQPNNLLYWKCIEWCKSNGYEKFDLGGWQINAKEQIVGVNKFKERWGEIVYYHKDYPFFHAISRKLIRNFSFVRWLRNRIKR